MKKKIIFILALSLAVSPAWAQKKAKNPKNIILMVGDGMGVSQIYAGMTGNFGQLNLERMPVVGFHKNQASNSFVVDSAAGATAFSCGVKTYNGAIGVDAAGNPVPTILEIAEENGLSTGLIATCSITHATPASFISHQPSRSLDEDIAKDFLATDIDVFIGGGRKFFANRKDGLNLIDSLRSRNYQIANSIEEVQQVKNGKLAAFLAEEQQARVSEGRGDELVKSTEVGLQLLQTNKKGMFLMIEGSQIDWGGHGNNTQYIVEEMIDFDKAIGRVLDFAEKDGNTLVIITADHETGGFSVNKGDTKTGMVEGKFTTGSHTGVMIPVFAYGPGSEKFAGFYENTEIFHKMVEAFGFKK
ncbi:alkaline phosphatase [Algoriphagus aquaeductus]|uniref:Alkaline phosphatase n=1 Tax=Algoriphagus aquaeductus TaxID=475299 RepID=A0A326RTJ4_9BACT|nr:alkaline phosphatase [Algoriphagus aquaeductus]PZV85345.1 alkaline phosphatase [Algoriphagus aquaeductus]